MLIDVRVYLILTHPSILTEISAVLETRENFWEGTWFRTFTSTDTASDNPSLA